MRCQVADGRVYKRFGATLVLALVATNLYRAWTQSITCDEAFTYNEFLAGPVSRLFTHYDANHHILHSMLAKISISLLNIHRVKRRASTNSISPRTSQKSCFLKH